MKVKLLFKSGKNVIEKKIELDASILMSLLNDETIIEIAKQVGGEIYQNFGSYLISITDVDGVE